MVEERQRQRTNFRDIGAFYNAQRFNPRTPTQTPMRDELVDIFAPRLDGGISNVSNVDDRSLFNDNLSKKARRVEGTTWKQPFSLVGAGVAEQVARDINKDWGGYNRVENEAAIGAIPWSEARHPNAYFPEGDPIHRILNLRQLYLGIGGNIGPWGYGAYADIDDEKLYAYLKRRS